MNRIIDLHTHTNASDGTYTPEALIDYAAEKGLSAIAVTDHDTLGGLSAAIERGKQYPELEIIPGIELSSNSDITASDIHILGYYLDMHDPVFQEQLTHIIHSREIRNDKMIQKFQDAGIPLTMEDVTLTSDDGVITRAHFAKALENIGAVKSMRKAFDKYIGDGQKFYVEREKVTQKMAIEMILDNGGVPVIAHPILYKLSMKALDKLLGELTAYGLKGIEGIYTTYQPHETQNIRKLAKAHNLIITGGSDFHGSHKPGIDLATGFGGLKVPYDIRDHLYTMHQQIVKDNLQTNKRIKKEPTS